MPLLSPEMNARMQGPPGLDPTEDLFKQRFADMAYKTLNSKFAELAPHVVTFKILKADIDDGSGVGVIILDYNGKTVYVPIVMVDSVLKPMELFYYKDLNVFLPLTLQWLDEIMRDSVSELGESAKLPNEVPQDVDLRDLVFPPLTSTGRVGYASAQDKHTVSAVRMFKEAEFQSLDIHPAFLEVLTQAPRVALDGVKLAFQQQPVLLQKLAANYGIPALISAMQTGYQQAQKKEAAAAAVEQAIQNNSGEVFICGSYTSPERFTEVFEKEASAAFQTLLKQGYVIKDARKGVSRTPVKIEKPVHLNSPGPQAGWFRLFFADGAPGIYFVIPFPKEVGYGGCRIAMDGYSDTGNEHKSPTEYLVVKSDGKEAWTCKEIVGESLFKETDPEIQASRLYKMMEKEKGGDKPSVGSYGIFICKHGRGTQVTKPVRIAKVISDGGVVRLFSEYGSERYVIDGDPSRKKFQVTQKGQVIFVPNTAKFVQIFKVSAKPEDEKAYRKIQDYERTQKSSVVDDPALLLRSVGRILADAGGEKVTVKKACMGEWWVGPGPQHESLLKGPATVKVASLYGVSIADAEDILADAQEQGRSDVYILGPQEALRVKEAFVKIAQPPMGPAPAGGPGGGGMPPEMAGPQGMAGPMSPGMPGMPGMDLAMMGMPQAPGVSPTELAIGEAVQQLQTQTEMQGQETQAQMAQLEQQMAMQQQSNEQLVGVLQGIQQRSQEIGSATGGAIPPQTMESPEVAAGTLAPPVEPDPGPMTPIMDQEAVSPEMVAQQINPEMVDQVSEFQERGLFDTAAVGMLANAPLLQEIVAAYVPNLEKAVDNLGRILLTLWMKEKETKLAIGDDAFIALEDKLRSVFKNLGEIILDLSHNATSTIPEDMKAQAGPM